jgi:SAM-dependent methyltransferase
MQLFRALYRLHNLVCDLKLNVSTSGHYDSPWATAEHLFYSSIWYIEIFRVLRFLQLSPSDVFVDIGCGKGRVLCCAARYRLRAITGIEDIAEMAGRASANALSMCGRRTEIVVARCRAEDFDYVQATALYLYNPFGESTLARVLDRVKDSLRSHQRELRIAYVNPRYERVMEQAGWLERYERWLRSTARGIEAPVSFWRKRPGSANLVG